MGAGVSFYYAKYAYFLLRLHRTYLNATRKEINARRQDQAASGKRSTVQHECMSDWVGSLSHNYMLLMPWTVVCSGYDRINEDQANVLRPPSGKEGGEVTPSRTPHSTSDTKRSSTAA